MLSNVIVNDVVGIRYQTDNTSGQQERICRVIKVRNCDRDPIAHSTRVRRPDIERTSVLVTCRDTDGKIRSFYADREAGVRRIPRLKVALLALKRQLPAAV